MRRRINRDASAMKGRGSSPDAGTQGASAKKGRSSSRGVCTDEEGREEHDAQREAHRLVAHVGERVLARRAEEEGVVVRKRRVDVHLPRPLRGQRHGAVAVGDGLAFGRDPDDEGAER
eukprot:335400-Prymnesium_polylepis.3